MRTETIDRMFRSAVSAMLALAVFTACADDNNVVDPPPPAPVASVAVSPAAHTLRVGELVTLQASPKAADGSDLARPVVWSSENETLATVASNGVVTTLAPGQAVIRAASEGRVGRSTITIQPKPAASVVEVRLSVDDEVQLEWDGMTQISAKALDADGNELFDRQVVWMSTRPSIAAVTGGKIEAQNPGVATITAVIDGVASSVGVRVKQAPVVEVYIDASTTGLEIGETFLFGSRVKRANGEVLTSLASWTSSAPAVARVTDEDMWSAAIEALAEGTFTLTATAEGVSTSLALRVAPRPTQELIYNRRTGNASEIFTLDVTSESVPVRINAGNVSRDPSPSPDGTQLVFAVSQQNITGGWQHDLYIVNRNGMNMRWLTRADGMEEQPQWSPDGSKILFTADGDGKTDLYTINVDGTGLVNVTAGVTQLSSKLDPAWSPNGSRIAFVGVQGSNYKVWTIGSDGTDARQVTTDAAGFDTQPTFSPDGQQIAFVRYNVAAPANGDDIMIVSANGGTPTRLALPGDQRAPAWSADGRYIAVAGAATAGRSVQEIYTMRPDGSGLRLRTVAPAWGGGANPAWINKR
jgi:Tol biopolymer transport system component/uncharacterized protein YjdB